MKKVLVLIGKSGSGKSTIAQVLSVEGHNVVNSYTTREKRYQGEEGHEFVTLDDYADHREKDITMNEEYIVAIKEFDKNIYWATIDQFKEGWNIYIVDADGYMQLKEKSNLKTLGVYINTDLEYRYDRLKQRDGMDKAIHRINYDRKAFKVVKCDAVVDNNDNVSETVEEIKELMRWFDGI